MTHKILKNFALYLPSVISHVLWLAPTKNSLIDRTRISTNFLVSNEVADTLPISTR